VTPTHVRIRQRKSFYYSNQGNESVWVFDISLTWSGNTKEEAELSQRNDLPTYEIECECLSPTGYRVQNGQTGEYVMRSLLLKMLDFYSPTTRPPSYPTVQTLLTKLRVRGHH
jgi:hypothetical protein